MLIPLNHTKFFVVYGFTAKHLKKPTAVQFNLYPKMDFINESSPNSFITNRNLCVGADRENHILQIWFREIDYQPTLLVVGTLKVTHIKKSKTLLTRNRKHKSSS